MARRTQVLHAALRVGASRRMERSRMERELNRSRGNISPTTSDIPHRYRSSDPVTSAVTPMILVGALTWICRQLWRAITWVVACHFSSDCDVTFLLSFAAGNSTTSRRT
jgi:hypothetical protein